MNKFIKGTTYTNNYQPPKPNTTPIAIIILIVLAFTAVVIPVSMKRQNRKNCLEMQRYEKELVNYQVKPQIAEYCYNNFKIEFNP